MNRRHYHIYHCFRLVQTERASCTGASVICQDARIRGFRVVDSGGARDPTLTSSSHRRNSRTQVAAKSDVYRMQLKASAPSVSKLGLLCRKTKNRSKTLNPETKTRSSKWENRLQLAPKTQSLDLHQCPSFASGYQTMVQEALPRAGKAERS